MSKLLYYLFIRLYFISASALSLFSEKARLWVNGRKQILDKIKNALQQDSSPKIWIHCASLGEFEQAKPLMVRIKSSYPSYKIFLTFFSPSGYEVQKNNQMSDFTFYLPLDTRHNAKTFFNLVQPKLILMIKYELWLNYIEEAERLSIPMLLLSARFTKSMTFLKPHGAVIRTMLKKFDCIFVQNDESKTLLESVGIKQAAVCGDTRFDRVIELLQEQKQLDIINTFCGGRKVLVAGSTWREDDLVLDHYVNMHSEMQFIIAPHDVGKDRIQECKQVYKRSVLYSQYIQSLQSDCNTLIIDNIGMLKYLYRYADICFVGGAFGGDGIHNVLEAAVYSKPVLFGPNHEKFPEAAELINADAAFEAESAIELEQLINELLSDTDLYNKACAAANAYVQSNKGATKIILDYIQAKRLLTN